MSERATERGGTLEISSLAPGTRVRALLPGRSSSERTSGGRTSSERGGHGADGDAVAERPLAAGSS